MQKPQVQASYLPSAQIQDELPSSRERERERERERTLVARARVSSVCGIFTPSKFPLANLAETFD